MANEAGTRRRRIAWVRWLGAYAIGAAAGALFSALNTPIPWMLGPLLALASLRVAGVDVAAPVSGRYVGQWLIGTALGLYFTPAVVRQVVGIWYLLAAGAVFAILVGYLSALILSRLSGLDRTTALFGSVPGGAAEMAVIAERFGGRVDRVAAAQSLRILLVVVTLPFVYRFLGIHGSDAFTQVIRNVDARGLVELLGLTLVGGLFFLRLRVPNAFVLGSLAVAIPLTAAEVDFSAIPVWLSTAAQCLIGCALGSRFQRDFLKGAHRFVGAAVASVLFGIVLSALFAFALARLSGLNPATLILGMAPGGIAEMGVTAKVLQLGVPLVTAFHVVRVVVILLSTAPLYSRLRDLRGAPRPLVDDD